MKKIQCQLSAWVSAPPTSRPTAPPQTATKTYELIARARSRASGNSATMIARITDDERAPPNPWTNRATISIAWSVLAPQAADAAVNTKTPIKKTRRRPKRSPSRPASRSAPPNVRR